MQYEISLSLLLNFSIYTQGMMGSAFWPQRGGRGPKFQLKTLILISSYFLCAGDLLYQIDTRPQLPVQL